MFSVGCHPFRDVIAKALYAPGAGYYTHHIRTVGRSGDFSTTATLGSAMARALARWAVQAASESGVRHLIEVGAGDGSMAHGILAALPWWHPLRRGYRIVDTSAPLVAQQRQRLGRRVRWFASVAEALADCGGRALVFGNELVDAFAPTVLQYDIHGWRELALEIAPHGGVREVTLPWSGDTVGRVFHPEFWPGGNIPIGQRIEWLDGFADWMRAWLPSWQAGQCLWIDYGDLLPGLYARRPFGTLRAYFRHQRLEGMSVFQRIGKQDITCDVNFTDLRLWGEADGLHTVMEATQENFLTHFGLAGGDDVAGTSEVAQAFRVLWQRR